MNIRSRTDKLKGSMLELAKLIHEAVGIQSPRLFIGLCILLFGIIGGGLGWAVDKGYRIKLAQEQAAAQSGATATHRRRKSGNAGAARPGRRSPSASPV